MHWANELIDKPWVRGARGPDAFDCHGLLAWLYEQRHAIVLPVAPMVPNDDLREFSRLVAEEIGGPDWEQVRVPQNGYAVALGGNRFFHHIGYYLKTDGGLVLHAVDGRGVVAQSITALKASGMRRIQFYKHRGAHY
jgi:cell wall-associated NlpC family hydrolase